MSSVALISSSEHAHKHVLDLLKEVQDNGDAFRNEG